MKSILNDNDKKLMYAMYKEYGVSQCELGNIFSKLKRATIAQPEICNVLKEQNEKGECTNLNSTLKAPIRFVKTLPDYSVYRGYR